MDYLLVNQTTDTEAGTEVVVIGPSDTIIERQIMARGTWGGATLTFMCKPQGDTEFTSCGTPGTLTESVVKSIKVRPGDTIKVYQSGSGVTSLTAGISL